MDEHIAQALELARRFAERKAAGYVPDVNTDTYGDETSPPRIVDHETAMRRFLPLLAGAAILVGGCATADAAKPRGCHGHNCPSPIASVIWTPTPAPTAQPSPIATAAPTPTAAPTAPPVPTPSPAPTPTPTPIPTPTMTAAPTATPAACPSSLQSAIDATPAGGTLTLGSCTFHETVTFGRAITVRGPATITGDGVRQQWARVWAADVTIDGLSFTSAALGGYQCGSLFVSATRFTLRNATLTGGCYSDVQLWPGATYAHLVNVDASSGRVVAVLGYQTNNALIEGGRLHDNVASTDPGNESGGIKLGSSTGVTVRNLESDHNVGPGVWFDVFDNGSSVTGVNAHDNTGPGIKIEICDTVTVSGNTVYRNALGSPDNAFGMTGGIQLSSDRNVTVTGNTAAWNGAGSDPRLPAADITFISQNRDPLPHTGNSATGNVIRSGQVQSWTDFGDPNVPVMSPNTVVSDTDPRITVLR